MGVIVRRISGQSRDLQDFFDLSGAANAGVDLNGRFFGDASRMTLVAVPNIFLNDDSKGATNKAAIEAALDSLAPTGGTLRLPNDKFYCEQIPIPATRSHLIIEGGLNTLIIPTGLYPNVGVFAGFSWRVGNKIGCQSYKPGDPNQYTVELYWDGDEDPSVDYPFALGDTMYLMPRYSQQLIPNSRLCQMSVVAATSPGPMLPSVTLSDAISTTLAAATATPAVANGQVKLIDVTANTGAPYYSVFERASGTIYQPRATISSTGGGTGAVARVDLKASLHQIIVVNQGNNYNPNTTTVAITPVGGGSGGQAVPNIVNGKVVSISITNVGQNYTESPTVTIDDESGSGQGAAAVATIGPSQIDSIEVIAGGSGYSQGTTTVTLDPPVMFAKYTKGGSKVVGTGYDSTVKRYYVLLDVHSRATNESYPPGSWVYLCTGPAFDNVFGRYFRVWSTDSNTGRVYFYENIHPEDFIADQTCLVPGPFIENVTIRNFKLGGLQSNLLGDPSLFFQGAVNIMLENLELVQGNPDLVLGTFGGVQWQNVNVRNCSGSFQHESSRFVSIEDSNLVAFTTHSYGSDFYFNRCRFTNVVFISAASDRFTFRDSEFDQSDGGSLAGVQNSDIAFYNCRVISTGAGWGFGGPRLRMCNVVFESGSIEIQSTCTDCVLENVTTPSGSSFTFQTGSSGRITNMQPNPGPVSGWVTNNRLILPKFGDPTGQANSAILYARDTGGGKVEIMAQFPTGYPVSIAKEP